MWLVDDVHILLSKIILFLYSKLCDRPRASNWHIYLDVFTDSLTTVFHELNYSVIKTRAVKCFQLCTTIKLMIFQIASRSLGLEAALSSFRGISESLKKYKEDWREYFEVCHVSRNESQSLMWKY